jgi:hypothetical protein
MNAPLELNATAAELAGEGFRVFEIPGRVKSPPVAGWQRIATSDPEKAGRIPISSNLGIATGAGLLVLDVDGEAGAQSLAALELMHGALPETCRVSTPSGGVHYYFTSDAPIANSASKIGPKLDIRGEGGYVVAPGSRTEKGEYTVAHAAEPAPAPQWLLDLCGKPREKQNTGAPVADAPADAIERARQWLAGHEPAIQGAGGDAHTYATACKLRDFGVSQAQTVELLAGEWNGRCSPPWDVRDLETKARNAYAYSQDVAGKLGVVESDLPAPEKPSQAATLFDKPEAPAEKPRVKGGTLHDMAKRINSGAYLVKGLLRRQSHAVMFGAPGEGKSYVALDLSWHIAAGREWHGRRVSQGPALYLAFEGLGGMPERAAALLQHYGREPVPFVIEPAAWNLRNEADRKALGGRVAEIRAEHFGGEQPALIVLDTLARAMASGDENSAQDMGALNAAVAALIASTGACVMLIHHSGKDRGKGARGSSALLGAVDTEIEVADRKIIASKQRDMAMGAPVGFKLAPVLVGEDSDGDPLQACVVLPDVAGAGKQWKPTGKAAHAWAVLCELSGDGNAPVDRGALLAGFRARAYPTGGKPESTVRSALDRALGAFIDRDMIEGPEGGPWRRAFEGEGK